MNSINTYISMNLKRLRKSAGLTLEELAGISGVSKSMLGEIERGSTNPTILVLWKIAEGLKIPLTKLIEEKKKEDNFIVRAHQMKLINSDPDFNIYSLFPFYKPHNLEIHRIDLATGSSFSNRGHQAGVYEYVLLIEGEIKLIHDGLEVILSKGDSIRFNGEKPHEFANLTDNSASFINIVIYK